VNHAISAAIAVRARDRTGTTSDPSIEARRAGDHFQVVDVSHSLDGHASARHVLRINFSAILRRTARGSPGY